VIFSPPYENLSVKPNRKLIEKMVTDYYAKNPKYKGQRIGKDNLLRIIDDYNPSNPDNIGNLKSDTYLQAMLQVYQQCYKVLKPQGLMILVTKNFIRNKQIIRLDLDTIKLCEQAGFSFVKRRHRKLPSQSFWRIIYHQKHPDVPVIDKEDILVFRKESNGKSDS
jgi:DNA modification methylase